MKNGFNRKETMALTGITSGKLSYWDETELVKPLKLGNEKKPTVIYSWQQIIQLKVIDRLRDTLSLQEIRKVLNFLSEKNYEHSIFECKLFIVDGELFLIEKLEDLETKIILASGKNKGQVMVQIIEPFKSIIYNLREEATKHHIYQYNEKVKGTPLASFQS